jgi:hypothetical protein
MAGRLAPTDPVSELVHLTNRAAVLVFTSGFAIIAALVTLPWLFGQVDVIRRFAGAATSITAVAITAAAWRARTSLRELREQLERAPAAPDVRDLAPGMQVRHERTGAPERRRPPRGNASPAASEPTPAGDGSEGELLR